MKLDNEQELGKSLNVIIFANNQAKSIFFAYMYVVKLGILFCEKNNDFFAVCYSLPQQISCLISRQTILLCTYSAVELALRLVETS